MLGAFMSEALRNLLEIYYDSTDKKIETIPTTISFQLKGKLLGAQNGNLTYDWLAIHNAKEHKFQRNTYSSNELLPFLNNFVEDFYVTTDRYSNHSPEKYDFDLCFKIDTKVVTSKKTNATTLDHLFVEYVNLCINFDKFLINPVIDVVVTRYNNEEYRRLVYTNRRVQAVGYSTSNTTVKPEHKDLEKWFSSIIASGATQHRWRKNRLEFNGIINKHIAKKRKNSVLFLIEYLYGKKLSKSNSVYKIHIALAGLDANDFGIKDAQEMVKLVKALENSYNSLLELY